MTQGKVEPFPLLVEHGAATPQSLRRAGLELANPAGRIPSTVQYPFATMVEDAGSAVVDGDQQLKLKVDKKDREARTHQEVWAGPHAAFMAQTPLPTIEEIQDRVHSKATANELGRVQLYLMIRNYFQAQNAARGRDKYLPRWALECYGMSKEASCAVKYLIEFSRWKKAPDWRTLNEDEEKLQQIWDLARQAGRSVPQEE